MNNKYKKLIKFFCNPNVMLISLFINNFINMYYGIHAALRDDFNGSVVVVGVFVVLFIIVVYYKMYMFACRRGYFDENSEENIFNDSDDISDYSDTSNSCQSGE